MSYQIIRQTRTVQVGTRVKTQVIRTPTGARGAPSETALMFVFPGLVGSNELAIPGILPQPGSFSFNNSSVNYEVPASGTSVFLIMMRPTPSDVFALYATATFTPTGASIAFAGSGNYPANAYFKCIPPSSPDPALYGPSIVLGGP